jgi:hypothetical protein
MTIPAMPNAVEKSFRDHHWELQALVRELHFLRKHNLKFKPGRSLASYLLVSEALVMWLVFERFLRICLAKESNPDETGPTLRPLMDEAFGAKRALLRLPSDLCTQGVIWQMCTWRNTLLHGDFEGAARESGCEEDFRRFFKDRFAASVERTFEMVNYLFSQVDHATGKRHDLSLPFPAHDFWRENFLSGDCWHCKQPKRRTPKTQKRAA